MARGETIDGDFVPVNALGVAFDLSPSENVHFNAGVESVFPDGDIKRFGDRIQASVRLSVSF